MAPLRVALPFQTVETVNESAQQRQLSLERYTTGRDREWRNRLIWGDKKYVLPSLLQEFAGQVDLIYIDPPFDTGADFSYEVEIDGQDFVKEPGLIELKAYRDTWGHGLDSYCPWFYETCVLLKEFLAPRGSIFVHLDWHAGHYAKVVLDEVFGRDNFLNEIVWWYYNKFQGNVNHFPSNHDTIFWYRAGKEFRYAPQTEERDSPVRQIRRAWDKQKKAVVNVKGEDGKVLYQESTTRGVDDVWRLSMLQPADETENVRFPTQKPETILQRVIATASEEDNLVLDCFVGSGTTVVAAEKTKRRWIGCDIGRFAIHTTRKRLLDLPGATPFVVQNLGKYERQHWQVAEFGEAAEAKQAAYRALILDLYHATPMTGYAWLHGTKGGRMVHVGSVDAPVSQGDVSQIASEFKRSIGSGKSAPKTNGVDVLGWDFAFEMNETAKQMAAAAGVDVKWYRIPHDVMDKRARDQGDVRFFELAALSVDSKVAKRKLTLALTDFVIPPDDVPEDVQRAITKWEQWIDYWAVDWDNKGDTFHNQWQDYRTRKKRDLQKSASHEYDAPGEYTVVVKVIDILGNDTTKTLTVKVG
ncbi:MAG: DNA methyltransferase [Dehalococcoidia bacterium]